MGRLTLNMLLSFAQFEREIAGERIYDKHSRKAARPPRADVSRTFSGEHLALRVRSHLNPTTNYAEVAYMIAPAWQGCRVGGGLQKRLRVFAQARRIKGFIAEILPSNQKMIRLARAAGDLIEQEDDEDGCKIKTTF
jgi:RimJ/RimL family protein N-acetyltransferase